MRFRVWLTRHLGAPVTAEPATPERLAALQRDLLVPLELEAVLSMGRQLGSAVGVAVLVAVLGTRPAGDLASFDRAWIVVLVTAAMTAAAGLAAGRVVSPG